MGPMITKPSESKQHHRQEHQTVTERRLGEAEARRHRDEQSDEMNLDAAFRLSKISGRGADDKMKLSENPWRSLEKKGSWDESYKNLLLEDIQSHDINEENVGNIRILLLGPIKAGKSSFINTIASLDKVRVSQVTNVGGAGNSMTTKLKIFRPKKLKNFRLLDTMGVEDKELAGLNIKDLLYVINGHVPANYKFNPTSPIDKESKEFNKNPKSKDIIHCVVFVMDANVVGQDNISDASRKKIKALQNELISQDIPRMVLLTKIDVLCEMIETDIANCYRSAAMAKAVNLAHELFLVPEHNIFPVQNYSMEMEMDPKKDILSLLALRQMIYFGTDFLNELSITTSDDEDSS